MGYVLKTNTVWGPMYYKNDIRGTMDKSEATVYNTREDAGVDYVPFEMVVLKGIKHDKIEIVKEGYKMKSFKKFVESAKKITESTLRDEMSIELGNTRGVLKFVPSEGGMYLEMWAGGSGYDRAWKNQEFAEKLDEARRTNDKALLAEVEKEYHALREDILKVANNYDREIERAMNKHGFRK